MADVSITKKAAAQQQIDAAVRMLFLHGEELIAIHTVAAAARNIMKDLAEARNVGHLHETQRVLEQLYRDSVTAVQTGDPLQEVHRDTLAAVAGYFVSEAAAKGLTLAEVNLDPDPTDPEIAAAIGWRARAIEDDKRTHKHRNKGANFLKHADRDADKGLNLGEIDTLWVIADAINLWMNLNLPLTDEMYIYGVWYLAVTAERPEDFKQTKAGPIHLLTFEQQIALGRYTLKSAITNAGRSTEWFRDDSGRDTEQMTIPRMFTSLK